MMIPINEMVYGLIAVRQDYKAIESLITMPHVVPVVYF